MSKDCIFCKIASKEITSDVVYESDDLIAFRDLDPQAPVHVLLIPKKHFETLNDISEEDADLLSHLLLAARDIARGEGISANGYRLVINCNRAAGQEVFHIHLHIMGGDRKSVV